MKEILRAIEKNYLKRGNPLGVKLDYTWAEKGKIPRIQDTILFTGLSYQLMPYTISVLDLMEKAGDKVDKVAFFSRFGFPKLPFILKKGSKHFYDALVAASRLLKKHGIEFGFLYDDEPYDGALFYEYGMDWLVDKNEKRIRDVFEKRNVKEVITISPHSYLMLKFVYDVDVEVKHILELVEVSKVKEDFALHEPCILLRKTNFSEKLRNSGAVLPEKNGRLTSCCGGPVELVYPELTAMICRKRTKELEEAFRSKCSSKFRIMTACPICLMNFLRCGFDAEDYLSVIARTM